MNQDVIDCLSVITQDGSCAILMNTTGMEAWRRWQGSLDMTYIV